MAASALIRSITHLRNWFTASFVRNPLAWLLLGAFLLAEYGHHETFGKFRQVCDLVGGFDADESYGAIMRPGEKDKVRDLCEAATPSDSDE